MHSLTKVSGIAVSVLVAATASVLLLLPGHPRMRTSRGAGMTPAIMVASATPPAPGRTLVVSGTAQRCLPPAAPAQHCRVSGDSTGGARADTAGRRRCRHSPLATALPPTALPHTALPPTARPRTGWDGAAVVRGGAWWAGTTAAQRSPAGQPASCPTGIPRRPR
jgi:hypothetical protein